MCVCICGRSFTQTQFTDNPKLDSLCPACVLCTDVEDTLPDEYLPDSVIDNSFAKGLLPDKYFVNTKGEYEHPSPLTLDEVLLNKQQSKVYNYG